MTKRKLLHRKKLNETQNSPSDCIIQLLFLFRANFQHRNEVCNKLHSRDCQVPRPWSDVWSITNKRSRFRHTQRNTSKDEHRNNEGGKDSCRLESTNEIDHPRQTWKKKKGKHIWKSSPAKRLKWQTKAVLLRTLVLVYIFVISVEYNSTT